jgi:hypothetical protein
MCLKAPGAPTLEGYKARETGGFKVCFQTFKVVPLRIGQELTARTHFTVGLSVQLLLNPKP